jgi:diguanylate cyclase (GGDEF)-like protein/PAS domain S-box-containing protein
MAYALIVEPGQARAAKYRRAVVAAGLEAVTVAAPEEALAVIGGERGAPAVVLSELVTPRSDGFEFLRQLRQTAASPPVVLLSSFFEMLDLAWTLREPLGVSQALAPTVSHDDLKRAIERALAGIPGQPPQPRPRAEAREWERLQRIDALGLVQEGSVDEELQKLVADAAAAFEVPVALVSLVLEDKQWFKAHFGLGGQILADRGTPREWAFCRHVVASEEPLIVHDATKHPMFSSNPLVLDGSVRGYAGAPLLTADGYALGTVCLVDSEPLALSPTELDSLMAMARRVAGAIHLRYAARRTAGLDEALLAERERGDAFPALAYLDAILGNVPLGVMLLGPDDRIAFVNAELAEMAGIPVDAILKLDRAGWVRHNLTQFDDPQPFVRMVRSMPSGPFLAREEFEIQRPRRRVLRWTAVPVQLPAGVGQMFSYFDVTHDVDSSLQRDLLAQAVARSAGTLRSIFDAAPVGLITRNVRGEILSTNQSIVDMLGYSDTELRTLDGKALDPEQDEAGDALLRGQLLSGERDKVTRSSRYRKKNGGWLSARLTASLVRDSDGTPQFTVTVIEDVGETQRLEAELSRSEAIYRSLARNMPNGALLMFDKDLRYLACDGARLLKVIGRTREELVGHTLDEVATPASAAKVKELYLSALRGEERQADYTRDNLYLSLHTGPVYGSDGTIIGGMVAVYDITAQKVIEEQLRRETAFSSLQAAAAMAANESASSAAALQAAIDLVCRHTGYPIGHAFVKAPGAGALESTGLWNSDVDRVRYAGFMQATGAGRIEPGVGFLSQILTDGKPRWLFDVPHHASFLRRAAAAASGLCAGFVFPVVVGEEVVALLEFYTPEAIDPDHKLLEVMGYVGVQLGRAVERERDRDQLRELSLIDELTGLYNRRGFLTLARQQLTQSQRDKRNLILMFADLDGMKQINDRFGHDVGDQALVATAKILKRSFRGGDIVARLGGDEFVVLASGISRDNELSLRRRVESELEAYNAAAGNPWELRISLGSFESDFGEQQTVEDLLTHADRTMYEQKTQRKLKAVPAAK